MSFDRLPVELIQKIVGWLRHNSSVYYEIQESQRYIYNCLLVSKQIYHAAHSVLYSHVVLSGSLLHVGLGNLELFQQCGASGLAVQSLAILCIDMDNLENLCKCLGHFSTISSLYLSYIRLGEAGPITALGNTFRQALSHTNCKILHLDKTDIPLTVVSALQQTGRIVIGSDVDLSSYDIGEGGTDVNLERMPTVYACDLAVHHLFESVYFFYLNNFTNLTDLTLQLESPPFDSETYLCAGAIAALRNSPKSVKSLRLVSPDSTSTSTPFSVPQMASAIARAMPHLTKLSLCSFLIRSSDVKGLPRSIRSIILEDIICSAEYVESLLDHIPSIDHFEIVGYQAIHCSTTHDILGAIANLATARGVFCKIAIR